MSLLKLFRRNPELSGPMRLKLCITVVVEPDGDMYHAYAPGLRGLHADGSTEDEALENAIEAAQAYLTSLAKHGDPLPIGPHLTVEHFEQEIEGLRIPPGAFLRHVTLQWPSLQTSGVS